MKKIAILGTGSVAQTWATKLIELGNAVTLGTRDVNNTLNKEQKDRYGSPTIKDFLAANSTVELKTFADAVVDADFVVNATLGAASVAAVGAAASNMAGKILIDLSNPLDFSTGTVPVLIAELSNNNSLGETLQKEYPNIKVVKTLNTMWAGIMVNPNMLKESHVNFISGNDADAKAAVKIFLQEFGWKNENILDLGDITAARGTESLLPIWLRIWTVTQNGAFNFKLAV
jgi:8-hydroxy-5-deazaflavin:NADPH oxidoreductase